jgi:hypothetical protein
MRWYTQRCLQKHSSEKGKSNVLLVLMVKDQWKQNYQTFVDMLGSNYQNYFTCLCCCAGIPCC